MVQGFVIICIAVIGVCLGFVAYTLFAVTLFGAATVTVVTMVALALVYFQLQTVRELRELQTYIGSSQELEAEVIGRLDELSSRLDALSVAATGDKSLDLQEVETSIFDMEQEITALSVKVDELRKSGGSAAPAENKVVSLLRSDEIVAQEELKQREQSIVQGVAAGTAEDAKSTTFDDSIDKVEKIAIDMFSSARRSALAENLRDAITQEHLELNLQPVVDLLSRDPVYYEASLRLKEKNGQYIAQDLLKSIARDEDLMVSLDGQILFGAIRMLRTLADLDKHTAIFCPLSTATLSESQAFEDIYSFLAANVTLAEYLILEIDQDDLEELDSDGRERLYRVVDMGFPLLLNNVRRFNVDGKLLHTAGFRFLKIAFADLMDLDATEIVDDQIRNFSGELERAGLNVIVCDVQQESQAIHLINFEIPLAQGKHFAVARPVKPELLNAQVGSKAAESRTGSM